MELIHSWAMQENETDSTIILTAPRKLSDVSLSPTY